MRKKEVGSLDDFSFRGLDLSRFGAEAAFGDSMRCGTKISRGEYALPGGGSVILGEEEYAPVQRQVTIIPTQGEATPAWRRRLLAWLQGGRGEMVVHNDPDVMRMVQFDGESTLDNRAWPRGALVTTMTLRPLAYDRLPATFAADTSDGAVSVRVMTPSALPMPLGVRVKAVSGTVTAMRIEAGGKALDLKGMSLAAGETVLYDAGQTLDDPARLEIGGGAAFGYVSAWAELTTKPGGTVTVTLMGGEGSVTVRVRGRWPD